MNLRNILILLSLFGISSTFMPWVFDPKSNSSLYGYVGDGVVTGFLFFVILLSLLYLFYKKKLKLIPSLIIWFSSLINLLIYITKVSNFGDGNTDFVVENPILISAMAGHELGIGVHVVGLASILLLSVFSYYYISNRSNNPASVKISKRVLFGFLSLLFIAIVYQFSDFKTLFINDAPEYLKPSIELDLQKMGNAFIEEDYQTFADYSHPLMIQSFGGRKTMIDLLISSADAFKKTGTEIKSITLGEIIDIQSRNKDIQVLITQNVTITRQGQDIVEEQRLIAVSEDNAKTWQFVSVTKKSKGEIRKLFPQLNKNLNFQ